jgi:hypothetical protein
MAKAGRRYPLVIYMRMIDRWWPWIFFIGLGLAGLAWPFYSDLYTRLTEPWRWMTLAGVGAGTMLVSFIMLAFRKSAYAQAFNDHLRLVTPFLRLNISYRRIRSTSTATMATLFPPKRMRGMQREIVAPISGMTAVIVELTAFPISPGALKFFLSPFFFKDKTPHFVILVQDWMRFSTELESIRTNGIQSAPQKSINQSLLSKLPKK